MDNTTRLLLPEVKASLQSHPEHILELAEEMHPADLADLASALDLAEAEKFLSVLSATIVARIIESCEPEKAVSLFESIASSTLSRAILITDEMAADDRADLYADLPPELSLALLDAIDAEESRDIRQLLSYPEESAGSLMTTDFVALPAHTTTAEFPRPSLSASGSR